MQIRKYFPVLLSAVFLYSCSGEKKEKQGETGAVTTQNYSRDVRVIVFSNDSTKDAALGGFGYKLFVLIGADTAFKIIQPSIPAVQGQQGFKTFRDAEKTAELAAQKIRDGNSFPAISIEELDSLGIQH